MVFDDERRKLIDEYFEWMYHLVCNSNYYSRLSYKKLLYFLYCTEYIPNLPMDENRFIDGIDFKYHFGIENGYSYEYIEEHMGALYCNMLEMMMALSFRVEEQITTNMEYGDRTGQWFWGMIVSLGLGHMTDDKFDPGYCAMVVDRFLRNDYEPDGRGGLFTLHQANRDLRNVDIWCQFMWYLNENIYGIGENYEKI